MKHDLVYTWINSADISLERLRASYLVQAKGRDFQFSAAKNRFRDNGELRHSLLTASRFLPDLGRVHVAYAGELPAWAAEFPQVNFVRQADIVPSRYWPLFHSDGVEAFLHAIPGLAEYYVYANDDHFFSAPQTFGDFYDLAGQCGPRARIGVSSRIAATPISLDPVFRGMEVRAIKALKAVHPLYCEKPQPLPPLPYGPALRAWLLCLLHRVPRMVTPSHVAQPFIRSAWELFRTSFPVELHKLGLQKFRARDGIGVNFLYIHYLAALDLAVFLPAPEHAYIDERSTPAQRKEFLQGVKQQSFTRFCLNDVSDEPTDEWRAFVQGVMGSACGMVP